MTKTKQKKGSTIRKKKGKGGNGKKELTETEIVSLIESAEALVNEGDLEEAKNCYVRAIHHQPDNTKILDGLAIVDMQLGDVEEALGLLRSSVALAPTDNPSKWFYLAQLLSNKESLQAYEQGISLLSQILSNTTEEESSKLFREQICGAYCSIAELFMTDLCFEENAETSCESAVTKALEYCPSNLEALQTMASLRISQCRQEDACVVVVDLVDNSQSMLLVLVIREIPLKSTRGSRGYLLLLLATALLGDTTEGRVNGLSGFILAVLENLVGVIKEKLSYYTHRNIAEEYFNPQALPSDIPSLDFLIAFCKLLVECCPYREQFSIEANGLLEQLLDLDDENPEIWFLLGFNEETKQPPDLEAAKEYYESGKEMIEKLIEMDPTAREAFQEFLQIFENSLRCLADPSSRKASNGENSSTLLNAFSKSSGKFSTMKLEDMEEEEEEAMEL